MSDDDLIKIELPLAIVKFYASLFDGQLAHRTGLSQACRRTLNELEEEGPSEPSIRVLVRYQKRILDLKQEIKELKERIRVLENTDPNACWDCGRRNCRGHY